MKKGIVILLSFVFLLMSCNMGMTGRFSDYYYYNQNKNAGLDVDEDTPSDDIEVPEVDPDTDPFVQGDWNRIDYKFDGKLFDTWLLEVQFNGQNIPQYNFFDDGTQWTESQEKEGYSEVSFDASNRGWKAQGITMNPLKVYRYNHKNPLIVAEGTYNDSPRMERFLFYRIIGDASIVHLDQYLIAVDTYSKLVFAYAKVDKIKELLGNKVPISFEPVENFGEKKFFYEYDPIGYVKENGEVVLYQEYKDAMIATDSVGFFPAVKDPTRDIASENGPGRSPYYIESTETIEPDVLIGLFKGKTYKVRDTENSLVLHIYAISEDGNTLTVTRDHFYDGQIEEMVFSGVKVVGSTSVQFGDKTVVGLSKTDADFGKLKDAETGLILVLNYEDLGPDFLARVQDDPTFVSSDGKNTYTFQNKGQTLIMNGEEYTYLRDISDVRNRGIYKSPGLLGTWYYGVELSSNNLGEDQICKMTDGALFEGIIIWSTLDWEAIRQP